MASEAAKACLICGFNRAVDRCHIIPRRTAKSVLFSEKLNKALASLNGKNIVILCKNHHWLFDHHGLTKEEFDKIKHLIIEAQKIVVKANKKAIRERRGGTFQFGSEVTQWINEISKYIRETYADSKTN